MNTAPRNTSTFAVLKPIEDRDRAFMFKVRDLAGGRMQLIRVYDRDRATACVEAGYCRIDQEAGQDWVHLKDSGRRYLDQVVRVN